MTGGRARVLIVGGEASGDLYGGLLMKAMATINPEIGFEGVGGPDMSAAGIKLLGDAGRMGVTGLFEVVSRLPVIWKAYGEAKRVLLDRQRRPDLAILIDYPDFNLRLAHTARQGSVPVLYFVSPQVWAWRRGRVKRIAERVDRMLVILPFEEGIYREAGVPVTFIGHPLLDLVLSQRDRRQALSVLGLDSNNPVVTLLPGSRENEVSALLPSMLGAAHRLRREFRDLQFIIPVAPTIDRRLVERYVVQSGRWQDAPPVLALEDRYDAIAASDAATVASGTATLETALLGTPMVIVYRMNPVTFALARRVSTIPHIGMPNLIAGERVVPELVQGECSPDRIALELRKILTNPPLAASIRDGLSRVRARLGSPGAIARAARVAWGMIGRGQGVEVACGNNP